MTPRRPFITSADPASRPIVPARLRGYLRLGAWICGAPANDPDFECADFCVLLDVTQIHRGISNTSCVI